MFFAPPPSSAWSKTRERGKDGLEVDALGDEVEGDKILHDGLVVPVDEVRDRLDHSELDVVVDVGHQPEIQDGQSSVRGADEVPRVRIGVEKPGVEELLEVADDADVHQISHVVRGGLAELLSFQPLRRDHLTTRVLRVRSRHHHLREIILDARGKLRRVLPLLDVVQLLEESLRPLVQQRHHVRVHLRDVTKGETESTDDVQVDGDRLQHRRALHLHSHRLARGSELPLVHLPEGRRRDGVRPKLGVNFLPLASELRLKAIERGLVVEGGHLVAQLLELGHCVRGKQIRSDGERLAQLDVRRAEGSDDLAQLNRALHRVLLRLTADDVGDDAGDEPTGDGEELHDALRHRRGPTTPVHRDELGVVIQRQAVVLAAGGELVDVHHLHLNAIRGEVAVVDVGPAETGHEGVQILIFLHLLPNVPHLLAHVRDARRGGGGGGGLLGLDARIHHAATCAADASSASAGAGR